MKQLLIARIKLLVILFFLICLPFFHSNGVQAINTSPIIPTGKLKEYALNGINVYSPCVLSSNSGNISSICGNTAKEKYWSALRAAGFEDIHIAAMFGSAMHEGSFGPTLWEWYNPDRNWGIVYKDSHQFRSGMTWDRLLNNCDSAKCGGVGAFQITWELSSYLQGVKKNAPDLIKYFQDPSSYQLQGDPMLKKIGATDFDRLVQLEIDLFVLGSRKATSDELKTKKTLDEATDFWTEVLENCDDCCGSADTDKSCGQLAPRRASAKEALDIIKTFSCSGSESNTSFENSDDTEDETSKEDDSSSTPSDPDTSTSGSGITWIGDSYSVAAKSKGLLPSDADVGSGTVDTASSYIQVSKFVSSDSSDNPSCLKILKKVIEAGSLRPSLVFACGTNGGWSDDDISKFKKLIKDQDVKVVVVNSKTPKDDYADSNKRLKKLADENSNIALADWASVYKEEYFESDPGKIHPYTDPGFQKWTEVINDAMSGNSCTTYEGDYPSYPQCGSSWSNKYYGTNSDGKDYNMCDASCGASSMAMLATVAANQDIFPDNVADLLGSSYYWATSGSGMSALDKKVGDKYGFEVIDVPYDSLDDAEKKMKQYLDDGYMLHFSGKGSYPFSQGGHYIGVFGWSKDGGGDKVMLANSGGPGNAVASLHDVIQAGLHGGSFSAIKSSKNNKCSNNSDRICSSEDSDNDASSGSCSAKVLNSVEKLISLAQKNGSEYPRGPDGKSTGGTRDANGFESILNNGAPMTVDCTGFASLVMYDAFGVQESFSTWDIDTNANYVEIPKSEVQPGDIFSYNSGCTPHGGIVIEMKNGKFTNIAQTGRSSYITKGFGGKNNNIGYSNYSNGVDGNLRCLNGDATDLKFYRYKGCN